MNDETYQRKIDATGIVLDLWKLQDYYPSGNHKSKILDAFMDEVKIVEKYLSE